MTGCMNELDLSIRGVSHVEIALLLPYRMAVSKPAQPDILAVLRVLAHGIKTKALSQFTARTVIKYRG